MNIKKLLEEKQANFMVTFGIKGREDTITIIPLIIINYSYKFRHDHL